MKEEARTPAKHDFEHVAPTVIHDPDQDLTILAKWIRHGMEKGPIFWYAILGVVILAVVLGVMAGSRSAGGSSDSKAWADLAVAQEPGQKVEIAEAFPTTEIGHAARLQAASEFYFQAISALPQNRETALPQLKKALDLFLAVAKDAPKDSPEALAGMVGAARTYESRNELSEAVQQYKAVASARPGTVDAKAAEARASQLADPEVVAFYKELYTYKAAAAPSPMFDSLTNPSPLGGLPAGHPDLNSPTVTAPPLTNLPALPPMPATKASEGTGPLDIAPPPDSAPARKADTPSAKPAVNPSALELPNDPFSPATPKPATKP